MGFKSKSLEAAMYPDDMSGEEATAGDRGKKASGKRKSLKSKKKQKKKGGKK